MALEGEAVVTCNALLDHRPESVRSCVLRKDHKRPHYPGPWRAPTNAERKRIEAARPDDYELRKGMAPEWTERVRRFSR